MLQVFAGDAFLARRAALDALAALREGDPALEVVRLDEGLQADQVREALGQGGLFGRVALFIDLDEAFAGAGQNAERTAVIDTLAGHGEALAAGGVDAVVLDASATAARQKRWRDLGQLRVLPTPRFGNLTRWVAQELEAAGVIVSGDVAGTLVDLFGEDLPGIAGEVAKLGLLDGAITPERASDIAHRPASRSAFDLTDAIAAGDAASALRIARGLLEVGEAPVRVMAVLAWQIDLVVRCAALALRDPQVTPEAVARELKSSPYPTKKALRVARGLDEPALVDLAARAVAADVAMKTGRDPAWALESVVIDLAGRFARRAAGAARPTTRAATSRPRPAPSG
ncbi:MAG: DNA polymerase III subunit delta [Trueperaceae bacterium]